MRTHIVATTLALIGLLVSMLLVACGGSEPAPALTNEMKNLAVQSIMEYPQVRDAAISQDGDSLSLAIVVDYSVSEEYAHKLGNNFVRMAKSFGPGPNPGREVGEGVYDYLVTVVYPNQDRIALGAKVKSSPRITW